MGFWRYCERVAGFAGDMLVRKHIETVWNDWVSDKTVGECAAWLEKLEEITKAA